MVKTVVILLSMITAMPVMASSEGKNNTHKACNIKGNISYNTGEKIYHLPGQKYYAKTKITLSKGERYFCSESEAIRQGWRKSYQ